MSDAGRDPHADTDALLPSLHTHPRRRHLFVAGAAAAGAVLGLDPADKRDRARLVCRHRLLPLLVGSAVLSMSTLTPVEALRNTQQAFKSLDKHR